VLVAIFSEKQSHAAYLLSLQDVTRLDIVNFISHGLPSSGEGRENAREEGGAGDREAEEGAAGALEKYTVNLNAQAVAGRVDPLDRPPARGAAHDRDSLPPPQEQPALCRRGRGRKTAIAEGLARLVVEKKVPDVLADCTIYALDMGPLSPARSTAATSRRGSRASSGSSRRSRARSCSSTRSTP
jgi:ATP-dependent Clp protease ATP-binding subunit ClpA